MAEENEYVRALNVALGIAIAQRREVARRMTTKAGLESGDRFIDLHNLVETIRLVIEDEKFIQGGPEQFGDPGS